MPRNRWIHLQSKILPINFTLILFLCPKTSDSRLVVFACDFFRMKAELLPEKCDAIFDRGAFEAIDVVDRNKYVFKITSFLKANFRYILNAFDYQDPVFHGPPRPISPLQMRSYFKDFKCEILIQEDYPKGKLDFGVEKMTDIHYLIQPK